MRGQQSPLSFFGILITTAQIRNIVQEHLEGSDKFIVDVKIGNNNVINILMDGDKGVNIDDCILLSRYVESCLNRDAEDFELNVSSPGAESPVKELRQIVKAIGKVFKVTLADGKELQGVLTEVGNGSFELETSEKIKPEGKKSKQLVITQHRLIFNEIKQLKRVISFK